MHPGRACSTAAGSCCRSSWPTLQAPTGRTSCAPPTPHARRRAARRRRRGSATATGWSSGPPTRPTSTPGWSAAGVRVHELGPERRTLEDVVLERTGRGGRTGWPRRDAGRAGQAVPPAADLGDDPAAQRCCRPSSRCCSRRPASAPARHRAGVPVGGAGQRLAVRRGGAGDRAAAVPAGRGRGRRRRRRSPARPRRARCATCWSARSGRTRLLVAKLVAIARVRAGRRAVRGGGRRTSSGRLLLGNAADLAGHRQRLGRRSLTPGQIAWRTVAGHRLHARSRCSASRRSRCSSRR